MSFSRDNDRFSVSARDASVTLGRATVDVKQGRLELVRRAGGYRVGELAADSLEAQLAKRFPSVSIFDIDDLLAQVRSVLDKAVLAVQSVFVFTLFAGLTVLLAAVQSSRDERRYESAMLRTLGARRATVLQGVLSEFTTLGLLSGLLAAIGASVAAYFIDTRVLQLHYTFDWWIGVEGLVGGAVLVATTGWLATRSVVNQPPLKTLRA